MSVARAHAGLALVAARVACGRGATTEALETLEVTEAALLQRWREFADRRSR